MKPVISDDVPEKYRGLIESMLLADPDERPSCKEIFAQLCPQAVEEEEEESEGIDLDDVLSPGSFFDDDIPEKKIVKDDGSDLFHTLGDL